MKTKIEKEDSVSNVLWGNSKYEILKSYKFSLIQKPVILYKLYLRSCHKSVELEDKIMLATEDTRLPLILAGIARYRMKKYSIKWNANIGT